jgi:CheY-like chemotaxis protein
VCVCWWSGMTCAWRERFGGACGRGALWRMWRCAASMRLGLVLATNYDAVVLDVVLPDEDGVAICARLRADGAWLPVIMLTARDGCGIGCAR